MVDLGDIFRRYGPAYLEKYSDKMLPSHKRAIDDIAKCRTGEFGDHIDICEKCGYTHLFFHSCCNATPVVALNVTQAIPKNGLKRQKQLFYRSLTFMWFLLSPGN